MSFVKRLITVNFNLTSGTFAAGSSSLSLSGLRVRTNMNFPGGSDMSKLQAEIYGMTLSHMSDLMTYGNAIASATGKNP